MQNESERVKQNLIFPLPILEEYPCGSPTLRPPLSSPLSPSSSHTCVAFKIFPFLILDRTQVPESHVWHQTMFISSFSCLCEKGKARGLAFVSFPH